ncbi:MAG: ATP synthase F0 subunit B [Armatimonadota bacterium]
MDAETSKLLGFTVTVWVVNIVGFILLLAMLRAWLWRPIRGVVEGRAQRIAEQLRGAEDRLAEAERLRQEARKYREAQETEAARQRDQILSQAQREAEELCQKAREEARQIRRQGRVDAEMLKIEALQATKAKVAGVAGEMARKLLAGVLDEDRHQAVLDAALSDLDRLVREEERG